ncbi:hypothetical protein LINPERPRIM_LOCUS9845 [Linum perenne]
MWMRRCSWKRGGTGWAWLQGTPMGVWLVLNRSCSLVRHLQMRQKQQDSLKLFGGRRVRDGRESFMKRIVRLSSMNCRKREATPLNLEERLSYAGVCCRFNHMLKWFLSGEMVIGRLTLLRDELLAKQILL